jgi:hypothetical protein
VYVDGKFEAFKQEWASLLNEREIDMCLSGHKHELWPFIPGQAESEVPLNEKDDYLTDFNFPGFLVGRRSLTIEGDTQSNGNDWYTGLLVRTDFAAGIQTACYINALQEIPEGEYPFAEGKFREIRFDLKRP